MSVPSTRGIDDREPLQRLDRGLHEERHEAELHAVLLLELVLVARAQFLHGRQVHLVEGGQQRLRRLRLHQALGDARAQARHRHALLGARAGGSDVAAGAAAAAWRPGPARPCLPRWPTTSDLVRRPSRPEAAIWPGRACFPRRAGAPPGSASRPPRQVAAAAGPRLRGRGGRRCRRLRQAPPARRPHPARRSPAARRWSPSCRPGLRISFSTPAPAPALRARPCRSRGRRGSRRAPRPRRASCAR